MCLHLADLDHLLVARLGADAAGGERQHALLGHRQALLAAAAEDAPGELVEAVLELFELAVLGAQLSEQLADQRLRAAEILGQLCRRVSPHHRHRAEGVSAPVKFLQG